MQPKRNVELLAATMIAALAVLLLPSATGAQTAEGLSSDASYRYELSEDGRGVDVTIDLAVTNIKPNRSTSRGTTQYYFTGYYVSIPTNASDLVVTQNGSDLEYERLADDSVDVLDISFRRNLFYRNTANLEISFTLGNGGPRSDLPVRINEAYAGFEIWTTPSFDTASVEIAVPAGFESDRYVTGSSVTDNEDGSRSITIDDITSDAFFFDYVALRNDANLVTRLVEVDGIEIEIQHWPNDRAWADFVEELVTDDLTDLVDAVGLPWPLDQPLVIQESFSPALSGYGGWYDPILHVIEVGDEFDDQLVLHEITHVWSNSDLFASRWITEGLADEFASIVDADGDDLDDPDATSLVDANALPLLDWRNGTTDPEVEAWAYGASWTVTREITDMVGIDGLREIVGSAANQHLPYLGETEPETFSTLPTWRNYLDWIQERSGDDDVEDLFRDWVVPDRIEEQLDERSTARARYAELTEAGGDWANPLVVRQEMTAWDFEEATASIDAAITVLEERDRALAVAADLNVSIPDDAERAYQNADDDLGDVLAMTTELADNAEALAQIQVRFDAERSLFTRIGLIGAEPATDLAAARDAFEVGSFEDMTAAGEALDSALDDAEGAGQLRAGLAAGAGLLVLLGLAIVIRRRRRGPVVPDDISTLVEDEPSDPVPA